MSKKQFLAELSQYLTFVSTEQRDEIVVYYNEMLEQAGPTGESKLLQEIGTPMAVAITLKRRLEANEPLLPKISEKIDTPYFVKFRRHEVKETGNTHEANDEHRRTPIIAVETQKVDKGYSSTDKILESEKLSETEKTTELEAMPEVEEVAESETAPETEEVAESETEPETKKVAESETEPETKKVAESETASETEETVKSEAEPEVEEKFNFAKSAPTASAKGSSVQTAEAHVKPPMTFGRVMAAVGIAIVSVVIVAFFACIATVGGIVVASSVDIVISGFDSINYLSDQLMIFGSGSLIMAFGILLTWFAIWAAIRLIIHMIRSFNRTVPPEKSILKTIWKVILIILLVFVGITVICGGVSLCLGGDPMILDSNEAFSKMLSRLNPMTFVSFFKNSGLFG